MSPYNVSGALAVGKLFWLECPDHCAGCNLWLSAYFKKGVR